jgi:hypothetical protein
MAVMLIITGVGMKQLCAMCAGTGYRYIGILDPKMRITCYRCLGSQYQQAHIPFVAFPWDGWVPW